MEVRNLLAVCRVVGCLSLAEGTCSWGRAFSIDRVQWCNGVGATVPLLPCPLQEMEEHVCKHPYIEWGKFVPSHCDVSWWWFHGAGAGAPLARRLRSSIGLLLTQHILSTLLP